MAEKRPIFLFAFANDAEGSLRLGEEQNACWNELAALDQEGIIDCQRLGFATLEQVYREFNRFNGQVFLFHYGGHSGSELIQLRGTAGSARHLGTKIGRQKNLKLVFLNGCKNYAQAEALLEKGVPAVIATTAKVEDRRAVALAQQFYQALAGGSSIREAFESAKNYVFDKYPELKVTYREAAFDETEPGGAFAWGLYAREEAALGWKIPSKRPSEASISGKNIFSGSTITAGGSVSIGDQVQNITESKTSRNLRMFLMAFVPILAIAAAVLYHRYQQMQRPLGLTVSIDNQTPNPELDRGPMYGTVILQYGSKADTQAIVNETDFKGIPANYRGEKARLRFYATGFQAIDTTLALGRESITLPIRRDSSYARVFGLVLEEGSLSPLEGVNVSILDLSTQTGENGRFSLEIPFEKQRKKQRLRATKPGYRPFDREEPVIENEEARISLQKIN